MNGFVLTILRPQTPIAEVYTLGTFFLPTAETYMKRQKEGVIQVTQHHMDVTEQDTGDGKQHYTSSWFTQYGILLWRANT